jgi:hypothetical protein
VFSAGFGGVDGGIGQWLVVVLVVLEVMVVVDVPADEALVVHGLLDLELLITELHHTIMSTQRMRMDDGMVVGCVWMVSWWWVSIYLRERVDNDTKHNVETYRPKPYSSEPTG